MSSTEQVAWWRSMLVGIPLCLLTNGTVIFAVVESPLGSLGFFDDSPTTSDWLMPMTAGAVVGLVQVLAFGKRATMVAMAATLLVGFVSFIFIFPTGNFAIGGALAVGGTSLLSRWIPGRQLGLVPIVLLVLASIGATGFGVMDHTWKPQTLLRVLAPGDGPAVLLNEEEGIEAMVVTGTLANVDGCLGLIDANAGSGTLLVAWKSESSVSSRPYRLNLEGTTYELGDKVSVFGTGLLTDYRDLEAYRPDMPASCYGRELLL